MRHPFSCYTINFDPTDLLFINNISPHYSFLRTIQKLIYNIKSINARINNIKNGLTNSDID
jgi:hypothetical protein